jgi:hypothetical protein
MHRTTGLAKGLAPGGEGPCLPCTAADLRLLGAKLSRPLLPGYDLPFDRHPDWYDNVFT